MAGVDAVNPARIEVQEVEDDVAHVGNCEHIEIARKVRGKRQQQQVEYEVRPHGVGWRAV